MRDDAGHFVPGESGNPGGRPGTGLARTLGGRRARRALVDLLRVLGPGLTVVVVDARDLVLVAGGRDGDDDAPPPVAGPPDPEVVRSLAARVRAEAALADAGWHAEEALVPLEGSRACQPVTTYHGPAGEVLGAWQWYDLVDEHAAALLRDDTAADPSDS